MTIRNLKTIRDATLSWVHNPSPSAKFVLKIAGLPVNSRGEELWPEKVDGKFDGKFVSAGVGLA
jgi:hypothetical protein